MCKCEINSHPVTWDMIAEKLDTELEYSKSFVVPGQDKYLLTYFKGAIAYIHRYLKSAKVPRELYGTVYTHSKILGEICHHWMDEAVRRGGDTRDKDGVAEISVHNWLEQIRKEAQEV